MSQHNYPWLSQGRQQPTKETSNMKTKETSKQDIIEHVQEHASFHEGAGSEPYSVGGAIRFAGSEPYSVIWGTQAFWGASPRELVELIVAHEDTKKETPGKEFIEIKPDWQSFFGLAKQIATEKIPEGEGRGVVIEMLNFGQRLDKQNSEEGEA
jgi:hypothetical protein